MSHKTLEFESLGPLLLRLRSKYPVDCTEHTYGPIMNEAADQIEALMIELSRVNASFDRFTGEKFSERVHVALKYRAEHAERVAKLAVASLAAILNGHYPEDDAYKYNAEDDIYPIRSSDDITAFVTDRLKEIQSAEPQFKAA
jgi:hypothetical protein